MNSTMRFSVFAFSALPVAGSSRVLYRELIAAVQATRAELQMVAEGLPETVEMAAERSAGASARR
jgi:hypothetical protein